MNFSEYLPQLHPPRICSSRNSPTKPNEALCFSRAKRNLQIAEKLGNIYITLCIQTSLKGLYLLERLKLVDGSLVYFWGVRSYFSSVRVVEGLCFSQKSDRISEFSIFGAKVHLNLRWRSDIRFFMNVGLDIRKFNYFTWNG